MSDPTDGLVWCTNDQPHKPHRRNNRWRDYDYCSGRPVRLTAAEPTVPVPVSLIEDVAGELWEDSPKRAKLLALLSQPTPTVEPARGEFAADGTYSSVDTLRRRAMLPAPRSIADMVPGTTFTAELTRYPGRPLRFTRDHGPYVTVEGFNYVYAEVDPSTIRDVTPPIKEEK